MWQVNGGEKKERKKELIICKQNFWKVAGLENKPISYHQIIQLAKDSKVKKWPQAKIKSKVWV